MRAAQIKNNVVVNMALVSEFSSEFIDPLDADIGYLWDGKKFTAPEITKSREEKKIERQTAVDNIIVEIDGLPFDGDEVSQNRMSRAIVALQAAGVLATYWTLADNLTTMVTVSQLEKALVAAGLAQTAIWTI